LSSNYQADRTASRTRIAAGELPDVLQFMQVLWAVVHGLGKTSKRMAADIGVTGPQRLVLRAVGLFPGASAGDLAALLHLHPSTLTGVLQRLSDRGLLARVSHPLDRRRAVLRLTRRGHRVNSTARGTVEAALGTVLQSVSPPARRTTQRVLEALARELGGRQPEIEPVPRTGHRRGRFKRPRPASSPS
jgi:DNA-binding MarR family transcriptional regulator